MASRQIANIAKSGLLQKLAIAESVIDANKTVSCNSQYSYSSPSGYGNTSNPRITRYNGTVLYQNSVKQISELVLHPHKFEFLEMNSVAR